MALKITIFRLSSMPYKARAVPSLVLILSRELPHTKISAILCSDPAAMYTLARRYLDWKAPWNVVGHCGSPWDPSTGRVKAFYNEV